MFRPDDSLPSADAYDAFWTATEADLGVSIKTSFDPASHPGDTYAAFHAAADE